MDNLPAGGVEIHRISSDQGDCCRAALHDRQELLLDVAL
jgi:hypothetical protein